MYVNPRPGGTSSTCSRFSSVLPLFNFSFCFFTFQESAFQASASRTYGILWNFSSNAKSWNSVKVESIDPRNMFSLRLLQNSRFNSNQFNFFLDVDYCKIQHFEWINFQSYECHNKSITFFHRLLSKKIKMVKIQFFEWINFLYYKSVFMDYYKIRSSQTKFNHSNQSIFNSTNVINLLST